MALPPKAFGAGGMLLSGVSICEWVCEWVCASQKPCEHYISKTNIGNFTQFLSQM